MKIPTNILQAKGIDKEVGPWLCESCGKLSQFAVIRRSRNIVFCRNENCSFERTIDKRHSRILEPDGTVWAFDGAGNKWQVRRQ